MELNNSLPTKWDDYLETLLKVYKALNPEKVRGYIFTKDGGSGSGTTTATKGQEANSAEAKVKKYCQICAGKGNKKRATSHNAADCWDAPGNEGKRPAPKQSSSGQGQGGGQTRPPQKQQQDLPQMSRL